MARENYSATVSVWRRLGDTLDANLDESWPLDGRRLRLKEMTERAFDLVVRRSALEAEKQEITKELQGLLEEGRKLAHFLRLGLKQRYGDDNEKLVEFGIRPNRRRSRR